MTNAFPCSMRTMRKHCLTPDAAFPISQAGIAKPRGSPASGNLSRSGSSYGAPSPGRPICFGLLCRILDTRRRLRRVAKRIAAMASAGGPTRPARAHVGRRIARHRHDRGRPLGGNQQAMVARLAEPVASARTRFKAASRTSDRHKGCRRSGRSPDNLPSGRARGLPSAPGWCRAAGS